MNVWFLNTDEGLIWMEAEEGGKITIREILYFFERTVTPSAMVSTSFICLVDGYQRIEG
jgi:hypothetical protein